MKPCRPPLFRKRQFEPAVIVACVRWYRRFCLSLRDVEELMAERGMSVDHTIISGWTCSELLTTAGQRVDFICRKLVNREAAKLLLRKALANPDNRTPQVGSFLRSSPGGTRPQYAPPRTAK